MLKNMNSLSYKSFFFKYDFSSFYRSIRTFSSIILFYFIVISWSACGSGYQPILLKLNYHEGQSLPTQAISVTILIELEEETDNFPSKNQYEASKDINIQILDKKSYQIDFTSSTYKQIAKEKTRYINIIVELKDKSGTIIVSGVITQEDLGKQITFSKTQKTEIPLKLCDGDNRCGVNTNVEKCNQKDDDSNGLIDENDACSPLQNNESIAQILLNKNASNLLLLNQSGTMQLYSQSSEYQWEKIKQQTLISHLQDVIFTANNNNFALLKNSELHYFIQKNTEQFDLNEFSLENAPTFHSFYLPNKDNQSEFQHFWGAGLENKQYNLYHVENNLISVAIYQTKREFLQLAKTIDSKMTIIHHNGGTISFRQFDSPDFNKPSNPEQHCNVSNGEFIGKLNNNPQSHFFAGHQYVAWLNKDHASIYLTDLSQTDCHLQSNIRPDDLPKESIIGDIALIPTAQDAMLLLLTKKDNVATLMIYSLKKDLKLTKASHNITFKDASSDGWVDLHLSVGLKKNKNLATIVVQTNVKTIHTLLIPL